MTTEAELRQRLAARQAAAARQAGAAQPVAQTSPPPTDFRVSLPSRRAQVGVLARRYLACLAGEPASMLVVVGQAPLIGWLCTVVWGSVERDTPSLWFVLSLSAVWFGCITACREIVRERGILERERLLGLSLASYVIAKCVVLAGIVGVQVVLLLGAVEWALALRGAVPLQLVSLWLAGMGGVGLGLMASALAKRQEQAVALVPLLLLPQILFSEFAIPADQFASVVARVEKLMPVRWCYRVFVEAAEIEVAWGTVAGSLLAQVALSALLCALVVPFLWPKRDLTG